MSWYWLWVLIPVAALVVVLLVWKPLRLFGHEIQVERAQELFRLQRERLEEYFFRAAVASGKPRGLRWKHCEWEPTALFARERSTRQLAALVGVTIQFEAVEGGDMEGVAAVSNLRNASAVFFFHRGEWHTVGKALFNLNPDEALEHFKNQYEKVT
jgi:hypothetical protein